jgi:hypothetical protein
MAPHPFLQRFFSKPRHWFWWGLSYAYLSDNPAASNHFWLCLFRVIK